jgi:hypothetical protein
MPEEVANDFGIPSETDAVDQILGMLILWKMGKMERVMMPGVFQYSKQQLRARSIDPRRMLF